MAERLNTGNVPRADFQTHADQAARNVAPRGAPGLPPLPVVGAQPGQPLVGVNQMPFPNLPQIPQQVAQVPIQAHLHQPPLQAPPGLPPGPVPQLPVGNAGPPVPLVIPQLPQLPNVGLGNVAAPPPTLPVKNMGLIVGPGTKLADIARHFGDIGNKHLRLYTHPDGTQELHLHRQGKNSSDVGLLKNPKNAAAGAFLRQRIDAEYGTGKGDEVFARQGVKRNEVNGPAIRNLLWFAENSTAKLQAFKTGGAGIDRPGTQFGISGGGAGGVLLAHVAGPTPGSRSGVALKMENPNKLAEADFVGAVANTLLATVTEPLPFDIPRYERMTLPPAAGHAGPPNDRDRLDAALAGLSAHPATHAKATTYTGALASNGGQISKYELVNGTDVTDLTHAQRLQSFQSPEFARTMGKSAVLTSMMGLNDHAALYMGKTNFKNFMMGEGGRLTVVDFDPAGTNPPKFGFSDKQTLKKVNDTLAFYQHMLPSSPFASPDKAALDKALTSGKRNDQDAHPFASLINSATVPNGRDAGSLFDGNEPQPSDAEKTAFAAHTMAGGIEGLIYLRDNAEAFAEAHKASGSSAIADPDRTFGLIAKQLKSADLEGLLKRYESTFEKQLS